MSEPHDLAVRYAGEGTPILFIHGWEIDGSIEAVDFEPVFANHAGYRRIYVDLPGHGKTPAGGITNLDSILERLSAFVEKHILPSNFLVTGSSCGAYLARAVAFKYSNRTNGLLLRAPLIEPLNSKRDVDAFVPAIKDKVFMSSIPEASRKKLGHVPVQTPEYIQAFRKRLEVDVLPSVATSDSETLNSIRNDPNRYVLTADMHSKEKPFSKPTLILTGRQDGVVGYRDAWGLMESYPRATFVTLDRADHGLPVDADEVELFRALVVNWLRRVEETRRVASSK